MTEMIFGIILQLRNTWYRKLQKLTIVGYGRLTLYLLTRQLTLFRRRERSV